MAVLLALALPAVAGAADRTTACKDGGWQQLFDADGASFTNQGQCVSFVAQGGTVSTGLFSWLGPQPADTPSGTLLPFTTCSSTSLAFRSSVVEVPLGPDAVDVAFVNTFAETVTGGTLTYNLMFDGVSLAAGTVPLGDVMTLPTTVGQQVVWRAALRGPLPAGSYELTVSGSDQNMNDLGCTDVTFQLGGA